MHIHAIFLPVIVLQHGVYILYNIIIYFIMYTGNHHYEYSCTYIAMQNQAKFIPLYKWL